jgi:hypothetical protein
MSAANPDLKYSYEPIVLPRDEIRSTLEELSTRVNISSRALFRIIPSYIAAVQGFNSAAMNRLRINGVTGEVALTYGITDGDKTFSEAWGSKYIERLRDEGKTIDHSRIDPGQEMGGRSTKAHRLELLQDLLHGLDHPLPLQD